MCIVGINDSEAYYKFGNFCEGFIFAKLRSFLKTKSSRNGDITLSFIDIGKSCPSRNFLTAHICVLTLFVNIKFSRTGISLSFGVAGRHCHEPGQIHCFIV